MAQIGFTPIKLYYSVTPGQAPSSVRLGAGELAVNIRDGKLFYKDDAGVVKVLADSSTATGNLPGGSTGSLVYQSATGVTTYLPLGTLGSIVYAGATAPQYLTLGTTGFILTAGPAGPVYSSPSSVSVGYADMSGQTADIDGGSANQLVYQDATDSTNFVVAPTVAGRVLGWTGSAFAWVAAPAATTATSLAGGAAFEIPYQSAPDTTVFSPALTFNGIYFKVGGAPALPGATNPIIATVGSADNYIQTYVYNADDGTSSSSDFVAYPDNGTDSSGWADIGVASSTFADPAFSVTGPNESYLFGSAPAGSGASGNLVYATDSTGTTNYHQWYVDGFNQAKSAWKMQLTDTGLQLADALAPAYGGTGITAVGPAGNVLTSNGTGWVSATPVPAVSKPFVYFCAQF